MIWGGGHNSVYTLVFQMSVGTENVAYTLAGSMTKPSKLVGTLPECQACPRTVRH